MRLKTTVQTYLSDTVTPVAAYLRLRDRVPGCLLLESADYQPGKNALSYLCAAPLASFIVHSEQIKLTVGSSNETDIPITDRSTVREQLQAFVAAFSPQYEDECHYPQGVFGYSSYDAVRYFEEIDLPQAADSEERGIPDLYYQAFRFVLVFNHHTNELTFIENTPIDAHYDSTMSADQLRYLILHADYPIYQFRRVGEQSSNFSEDEFCSLVTTCKEHIQRGDVFQIVPSRRYVQPFEGDEFKVYRTLRSINPSPYLFYFDYRSFRIFGSSPEAQLVVKNGKATLYPIAGTYKRTHDEEKDAMEVERLLADEKESAEHVMLVDLARNDLSRHCYPVEVESFKKVQMYSHVIHLTSQVSGQVESDSDAIDLFADTFPMGTLSGAPKYRAMELLEQYESGPRRSYGGAIGFFGFDGSTNHAIVIRSFHSQDGKLYFQAGAGVVSDSDPKSEADEVRNKLGALQQALILAEEVM